MSMACQVVVSRAQRSTATYDALRRDVVLQADAVADFAAPESGDIQGPAVQILDYLSSLQRNFQNGWPSPSRRGRRLLQFSLEQMADGSRYLSAPETAGGTPTSRPIGDVFQVVVPSGIGWPASQIRMSAVLTWLSGEAFYSGWFRQLWR